MNKIATIIFFLTFCFNARADYDPLSLYEMIIKAEKIVHGTITELDSISLTLKIDGSLTSDSGLIKVERFENWTCASRWTEYQVGQMVFMFLTTWNGKLVAMSGGNEGELPILNNLVFIHGFSIPILPPPPPKGVKRNTDIVYFDTKHYDVYGEKYYGTKWRFKDFINSVAFIRNCFEFEYGKYHTITNWKIKCKLQEIELEASKSKLVRWVYEESQREKNER